MVSASTGTPVSPASCDRSIPANENPYAASEEVDAQWSDRLEAYVDLVHQLLSCPSGDEPNILQANQDLVDVGFLRVLEQVATQAEEQAEPELAQFLRQLSASLQRAISEVMSQRTPAYLQLIDRLLQCPSGEEDQVLAAHSDLVDAGFVHLMGQMAGTLALRGETEAANFLLQGAQNLAVQLGMATVTEAESATETETSSPPAPTVTPPLSTPPNAPSSVPASPDMTANVPQKQRGFLGHSIHRLTRALGLEEKRSSDLAGASSETHALESPSLPAPEAIPPAPPPDAPPPLPYLLLRLLQVTKDSQGNPQIVYPLLQSQMNQLSEDSASLLRQWVAWMFNQSTTEVQSAIAQDLTQFGTLCLRCPDTDQRILMELAIAAYESVLEVLHQTNQLTVWAAVQNNLAIAYSDRHFGDRSDNLEEAIAHYQEALEVYTFETYPQDWAMTQNNLALVYRNRQQGDIAANLERAISCHQATLQVYTQDEMPSAWATTHLNLAQVYEKRLQGEEAENLHLAITCYEKALQVFTREQHPQTWRTVQEKLEALQHYQQQRRQTNIAVDDHCLQIGDWAIPATEILPFLTRYNLLSPLLAELVIDRAIAQIPCSAEEEANCIQRLCEQQSLHTPQARAQWLRQRNFQDSDLSTWATRSLRLTKFKQQKWQSRLESYFLTRKNQLDQATYILLRHADSSLVQELYFRVLNEEQSLGELAAIYSQGPEAKNQGRVGPVELGQLPDPLARSLIAATPGQLLGPLPVGDFLVLLQLEQMQPARLDDAMRHRLVEEQFQQWLELQISQ